MLNAVLRSPALLVWALFILLTPFYIAPNGLPQPGDVLIFILLPATMIGWNGRLHRVLGAPIRPLLWFLVWVLVVNYSWAAILWKWGSFKDYLAYPLFYTFNAIVFFCALVLYQRFGDMFLRITMSAVFLTIVVQFATSFVYRGGDNFRAALFFNSPNQLGYYALLSACLIVIMQPRLQYGLVKASAGVIACAYLALISASRASLGAIAILLFLLVFSNPRIIVIASIAAVLLLTAGGPVTRALETFETRSDLVAKADRGSFIEDRGYDRVWRHKEHLLVGAGEGDNRRFDKRAEPREIHSSVVGVVFCYGIIGMGLFIAFVVRVVRGGSGRAAIVLLSPLAYTVAHQGLRFTMLWILLACYVALKIAPPLRNKPGRTGSLAPANADTVPM